MKPVTASRKTLSIVTFFAASSLAMPWAFADADSRSAYDVSSEADLRKYLTETYLPDGSETKVPYNNADLTLLDGFTVDTAEAITVVAKGSKIFGNGKTLSSSVTDVTDLSVKGSGDIFQLESGTLAVENITFAGTTDESKKTGRVFTLSSTGLGTNLSIGAGTSFLNRRLVADEKTTFRAQGGALISAHILDVVSLETTATADIKFSGNVAHGRTFSYDKDGEPSTEKLTASGGAVFTSGIFKISGAGTTTFSDNSAISDEDSAYGGAMFVHNASLNASGSPSTTTYPDSIVVEGGDLKFGVQVGATKLSFSSNKAEGVNASGGALAISGGYFETAGSTITFDQNSIKGRASVAAEQSAVGGGALMLFDSGRLTFDAGTKVSFSKNNATGTLAFSNVSGGAFSVSDSEFSSAGEITFSENKAIAEAEASSVFGGAAVITGTLKDEINASGETVKVQTTNVALSGKLTFEKNTAEAQGLSREKTTGTGESQKTEIVESSATGGALVISGGNVDGSKLETLSFSDNTAKSKTSVSGGALAIIANDATVNLSATGDVVFKSNKAELSALATGETQSASAEVGASGGAVFLSAGTLTLVSGNTISFTNNTADAEVGKSALGGAVYQGAGTLTLGAAQFAENKATASSGTARGGAMYLSNTATVSGNTNFLKNEALGLISQGGAIYSATGKQAFNGAATFSENKATSGSDAASAGESFSRGGAIFVNNGSNTKFSGTTTFTSNVATATSADVAATNGKRSGAAGGAVHSAGTLSFADATFENNSASVVGDPNGAAFGGAIYVAGGKLTAERLEMSENSASAAGYVHGGAAYVSASGLLDVAGDLSLKGNAASDGTTQAAFGGAIYSAGTLRAGGEFAATSNTASGTDSASGGAVYVASGSVEVSGTGTHKIFGNKATATSGNAFGGAVYAAGNFSVKAGTLNLSENKAEATNGTALGGAIYLRGGNVTLNNATVSNNTATVSNNTATGAKALGGGIYADVSSAANAVLTFSGNTEISGNSSTTGGAKDGIYVGLGTGAEAKGSVSVVFDADADVVKDDAGNTSLQNVETATVSDKITVAAGTFSLEKTGNGNLTLGDVAVKNDGTNASFKFNGGTATLGGEIAASDKAVLKDFSIGSGATVTLSGILNEFETANIAGTLNVENGSNWHFAKTLTLTGMLAISGATVHVDGAASISGAGTFKISGDSTIDFASDATLTAATVSLGTGTLTLSGAATPSGKETFAVTDKLVFTETGTSTISIGSGMTLALTKVERSAADVNVVINGTGTLIVYEPASEDKAPTRVDLSAFYEKVKDADGKETSELRTGSFAVSSGVKVKSGISVGEGVTLSLAPDVLAENSKNILLTGGTLLAPGSSSTNPLGLETFIVSASSTDSVLGEAGKNQVFRMVEITEQDVNADGTPKVDANGDPVMVTYTKSVSFAGTLDVTESTTLIGNVTFNDRNATLKGAGKLVGNVGGTGTVSIATVEGNLNVGAGLAQTLAGAVAVSGDVNVFYDGTASSGIHNNTVFRFSKDSSLKANNFYNYGKTQAGTTTIEANFVNAGTLIVDANSTVTFASGSTFTNGATDLAGVIDISASGSAVDFSAISANATVNNGIVRVDATTIAPGKALPLHGLDEAQFSGLRIEDINRNYNLDDRFVWDATSNELLFLGLNGEQFYGTLYGDLQRESINRTHEFLRAGLARSGARLITPNVYGEHRLESKYMRGYLEKMSQRGGEVSAKQEAAYQKDLAFAEKLNSPTYNVWAQTDFSFHDRRADDKFGAYDFTSGSGLIGVSMPLSELWELGMTLSYSMEEAKLKGDTYHKVESDIQGLSVYARRKSDWWDCSFAVGGMYGKSDTHRGEYSGDYNLWRLGALAEVGATLKAQDWLALRSFLGLSAAYARSDSFSESGPGNRALSLDAAGDYGIRTRVGLESAFLVTDSLQFSVRAAWLMDFGDEVCELDAYMPGTRTQYRISSRENETSAIEVGAYFNQALFETDGYFTELFGGYTGTFRSGESVNSVNLGINVFF